MSKTLKNLKALRWFAGNKDRVALSRQVQGLIKEKGIVAGLQSFLHHHRHNFKQPVNQHFNQNDTTQVIIFSPERLRTFKEYSAYIVRNSVAIQNRTTFENSFFSPEKKPFTIKGYSYPAQATVDFLVDYLYSDNVNINWRERLVCPVTQLNNRLRATVHFLDIELQVNADHNIYIAEQLTPLYNFLKRKYPQIVGSEYLGPDKLPGYVDKNGIRHEDATSLSFPNESLDLYLTFECLEHIPSFDKAFAEAFRVLKPGGKLFWSVPFTAESETNTIRAMVKSDGAIEHLLEPEYHGDPVHGDKGILCYQYFGWEMFDRLIKLGFSDVYAISFWSAELGYFSEQFLFCATK